MRKKTILVVCIAFIAATAIFLCENAYSVEEKEPYRLVKITVDLSSFEGDPQQIVDDIRNLLPKEYSSGGEWVLPIKTVDITTGEVSRQYPILVKEWDVQKIVEALEENGYKVTICSSPIITVDPRVDPPLVTYHHTKK